jgi:hypothetical protein
MVLLGYSGARGTLIYEKNLKPKISCQTPFNFQTLLRVNFLRLQAERSGQLYFKKKIGCCLVIFCSLTAIFQIKT